MKNGAVVLIGFVLGFYSEFALSVGNYRVSVILLAAPIIVGLFMLRDAPRLFLALLVLSLAFSARFRLGGAEFRAGGAEAAIAPLDFPLLGLALIGFLRTCVSGSPIKFRLTSMDKAMLLFLMAHLPSLILSPDKGWALFEILRLGKMIVLVWVIRYYVKNRQDMSYVMGFLFLGVVMQGVLAVSQSLLGASFGLGFLGERDAYWVISRGGLSFGRAGGTLGHANALANFFEMFVPLALAVFFSSVQGWLRFLSIGALGAGLVGVFLTFSRAGWGATLVGLVVVALTMAWYQKEQRGKVFVYAWVAFSLVAGVGLLFWQTVSQRLALFGEASWIFRNGTYEIAWSMIQDNVLWGVGANNYMVVAESYLGDVAPVFAGSPVHNVLLLILSETGLVGLLAFLVFLFSIVRQVRRLAKTSDPFVFTVTIGVWAGLVAFLAHAMLDWLFRYDPIYALFWFNLGLLLALDNVFLSRTSWGSIMGPVESDGRPVCVAESR